jgi:hypothetical protein
VQAGCAWRADAEYTKEKMTKSVILVPVDFTSASSKVIFSKGNSTGNFANKGGLCHREHTSQWDIWKNENEP